MKKKYNIFMQKEIAGFTVMEVLVATGIFVIMVLATFGIFSSVLKAQRSSLVKSRIEREAQLVLETLVKKIRTSRVDYAEYETIEGVGNPLTNPTTTLILIDQTDSRLRIQHNATNNSIDLEQNNGLPYAITANDVLITSLNFIIAPTTNPFVTGFPPTTQPRVTVVIEMTSSDLDQSVQVTVQQTVPQRGGF